MIHNMQRFAELLYFNEKKFVAWAEEHGEKHGAFRDHHGVLLVSTWGADQLRKAARAAGFQPEYRLGPFAVTRDSLE